VINRLSLPEAFVVNGIRLRSLHQINNLDLPSKIEIYRHLLPLPLLETYGINPQTLTGPGDQRLVKFTCPEDSGLVKIEVRVRPDDRDCLFYLELADTPFGQIEVLLFIVNDPNSERFDVDRDWQGQATKFGTIGRNIPEEIRAMQAGLAPGQVRRGLRVTGKLLPLLEGFVTALGHDQFVLSPLAYHNAILFERHGFGYIQGKKLMQDIHAGFQPGGELFQKLDASTPFRQPEQAHTVRGRSWAIHDGILGRPYEGVRMYRRVGHDAGVCTFPNAVY